MVCLHSLDVLSFSFLLWVFLKNISAAEYFDLERRRNCLIALDPHLVILWVRARTGSRVTGVFTGVFVTQVRDRCFEEPSEQPDVHSSSVWRDFGVFLFFWCGIP